VEAVVVVVKGTIIVLVVVVQAGKVMVVDEERVMVLCRNGTMVDVLVVVVRIKWYQYSKTVLGGNSSSHNCNCSNLNKSRKVVVEV